VSRFIADGTGRLPRSRRSRGSGSGRRSGSVRAIGRALHFPFTGTARGIRKATHAHGAGESGLGRLIELHAVNGAGDVMITVALASTVYLETMGRQGLQEVARQCAQKTAYAAKRISELDGFSVPFTAPRFNEFVVRGPSDAKSLLKRIAAEDQITAGFALSRYFADRPNDFLVCVTEVNSREQIDSLVAALQNAN